MRCPQFRFSIMIIVFDELKLIIFVSQGLTLSTASLVFTKTAITQAKMAQIEKFWCLNPSTIFSQSSENIYST